MPRLFVDLNPDDPDRAVVDADGLRHLRALRLGVGETFEAIVAPGEVRSARIEALGRRRAVLRLGAPVAHGHEDPAHDLILAVALADLGRFDSVIEKATELGATAILPLRSARTQIGNLTDARRGRWRRIARAACEQCGRTRPPQIGDLTTLDEVAAQMAPGTYRVVFAPGEVTTWDGDAPGDQPLALFIGPEGGFTDDEVARLRSGGAHKRSLGPRVLRFETAAAAALAIAGVRRK